MASAKTHLIQALEYLGQAREAAQGDDDLLWALNQAAARAIEAVNWTDQVAGIIIARAEERAAKSAENN